MPQSLTLDESRRAGLRTLARDGDVVLRVRGGCMTPALPDGSTVAVRHASLFVPGDVIACAPPGQPVALHRLLGWRPLRLSRPWRAWGVWTQGDRTARPDAPLASRYVLGRAAVRVSVGDRVRAVAAFFGALARGARTRRDPSVAA